MKKFSVIILLIVFISVTLYYGCVKDSNITNIEKGTKLYRIKQVDIDSNVNYSNIIRIKDK